MTNVILSSREILNGIEDIVKRNNAKVIEYNNLPEFIRSQMDTQVFDDIDYLLRYISALQAVLNEVTEQKNAGTGTFSL